MVFLEPMEYAHIKAESEEQFYLGATLIISTQIKEAIERKGSCIIGLSGGSTPQPIYRALAQQDIDWSNVFVFLVDERYCNATSDDSNQHMLRTTLLKEAAIPEENITFPDTSLPLQDCINKYSVDLKAQWGEYLPDVITLGIGDDGHIASLFPPLDETAMGDEKGVIHTTTDAFAVHDRISLSLNMVAAAQKHVFLLKGENKKDTWNDMLSSPEPVRRWPAKLVLEQNSSTVVSFW